MCAQRKLDLIEGRYRTLLARAAWTDHRTARLHYDADDDTLVVELVDTDPVASWDGVERLLVEFDSDGPDALPVSVTLTGVRTEPKTAGRLLARAVLGGAGWAAAEQLVARGGGSVDVALDDDTAGWTGLKERLQDPVWVHTVADEAEWLLGAEFVAGLVHVALTDAAATEFDEELVTLDGNEPADVVEAIAEAADRLASRHLAVTLAGCPIAVQLGGPVDTANGVVEYYDKPYRPTDARWHNVPLAELIAARLDREVVVFNDARAFATHELEVGLGRKRTKVVVLVVRQGIGAKLLHDGRIVEDFPMEIGVFMPVPGASLGETPDTARRSIEAESGMQAIVAAVAELGEPCTSIFDAADAAERSEAARQIFQDAGRGLARGMAAVQAVIDPDAWVVIGPAALVDRDRRGAAAFLKGLEEMRTHLAWSGLKPGEIVPRSTSGTLGARAAALAALRSERIKVTFHRRVER